MVALLVGDEVRVVGDVAERAVDAVELLAGGVEDGDGEGLVVDFDAVEFVAGFAGA